MSLNHQLTHRHVLLIPTHRICDSEVSSLQMPAKFAKIGLSFLPTTILARDFTAATTVNGRKRKCEGGGDCDDTEVEIVIGKESRGIGKRRKEWRR